MGEENVLIGDEYERTIFTSLGNMSKLLLDVHGDKVLQIDADTNEEQTASQIIKRAASLTRWLRSQKLIIPGDVITVASENRLEYGVLVIATFFSGCTFAPLNPEYTPNEIVHVVNLSKPKVIFCTDMTIDNVAKVIDKFPYVRAVVNLDTKKPNLKGMKLLYLRDLLNDNEDVSEFEVDEVDPDDAVATVLCSSGTTGLPKGVMATHANITNFMEIGRLCVGDLLEENVHRVLLGLTPFFHSLGFMYMFCNMLAGNLVIVVKKFKPKIFLEAIQRYRVTNLVVPPPIALFIVKNRNKQYDLSSLKDVRTGAAPMSKDMEIAVKEKLSLHHTSQAYGMTETTLGVIISRTGKSRVGSVGQLVPGMMAKVIDEEGKTLGPHKEGEVCFKGPLIMKGYIGNEEATRNTIDKDGWIHTGDVAYYDNDGYFFIVDRIKELVKYKAFQVAPAELEGILLNHEAVIDAAVTGLPDEDAGELPLAFVVKRPESDVTEKELEQFVAGQVSRQKLLRGGVYFVDEIPKNPTGKILRRVLRQKAVQLKKSKL